MMHVVGPGIQTGVTNMGYIIKVPTSRNEMWTSSSEQKTFLGIIDPSDDNIQSEKPSSVQALYVVYESFMKRCESKNLADKTKRFYRQQVFALLDYCISIGIDNIAEVSEKVIEDHLRILRDRGLRDASVQAAYRGIRAFMTYSVENGLIETSPLDKLSMPRAARELKPVLDMVSIGKLLDECHNSRDRALVLMLIDSGLRAAELINLTASDIVLKSGRVHVRNGKGRKDRYVYISERTSNAIVNYYDERGMPSKDEPIWQSLTTSEPLKQNGLNQMLGRLGKRAGLEHTNPHCFRRSFAVLSLEEGIDLYRLAHLMGHGSIDVLRSYLHLVERHAREAHEKFGPLNGFEYDFHGPLS